MKYHFEHIENGQIAEGYAVINISGHEAEIANDDVEAILLAEKHGGELAVKAKQPKPDRIQTSKEIEPKGDNN